MTHQRKIAVIGLGYVGLPVAVAFARSGAPVVGFDIDRKRVDELRSGRDRTREVDPAHLKQTSLRFDHDPSGLADSDFYIVTVPTPIDGARRPDLGAILSASAIVGDALKRGDIVVYEVNRISRRDRGRVPARFGKKVGTSGRSRLCCRLFA